VLFRSTCVTDTREHHAADLGVDLARAVALERGFPLTRANRNVAVHNIYSNANFAKAKKSFDKNYNPVQYLLDQAKYFTRNKVFADMCHWYGKEVFPEGLDEKTEKERINILGCDFVCDFERKDSAVLYFLFKNGLITV